MPLNKKKFLRRTRSPGWRSAPTRAWRTPTPGCTSCWQCKITSIVPFKVSAPIGPSNILTFNQRLTKVSVTKEEKRIPRFVASSQRTLRMKHLARHWHLLVRKLLILFGCHCQAPQTLQSCETPCRGISYRWPCRLWGHILVEGIHLARGDFYDMPLRLVLWSHS